MKKTMLLSFVLLFISLETFSQTKSELFPCGTVSHRSDWLKAYQKTPHLYRNLTDTLILVPLSIHLLGNDDESGYFPMNRLIDALCILNDDFVDANIQFYTEGEINYIPNTAWNTHDTILEGGEMMFANNIDNTLNCYFVSDPAGNCGYNLPYAGMAMSKACSGPNDHTWTHEMGHGLSLPHPFLGWEGGISHDGSIPVNYNAPAPETVLYDYTYFKDTLILDTMIIDTAYVEKLDGSNCEFAADGFCDTPPDYLNYRWQCNGDSLSTVSQIDPNNESFISDGHFFMSYALDNCVDRFSEEQILAMRANLVDEKADLLYDQDLIPAPNELANLVYPINDELVPFEEVIVEWEAVPEATGYLGTVYLIFGGTTFVPWRYFHSNETSHNLGELSVNKNYAWEISAYNSHYFCQTSSEQALFETVNFNNTSQIEGLSEFSIQPNPISGNENLQVILDLEQPANCSFLVYDLTGRTVFERKFSVDEKREKVEFNLPELANGMYLMGVETEDGSVFEKVVVK